MNLLKQTLIYSAVALAAIAGNASAEGNANPNFAEDAADKVVHNSFGECWRTGTYNAATATTEGCGYTAPAAAPKAAPAPAPAPVAAPAPAPAPAAAPAPKVFSLKSDVLFDFGKSTLKPAGKTALDNAYEEIKTFNPSYASAKVVGYTDRIGSVKGNQKLSQKRAQAVVTYLKTKQGVTGENISAEGRGKADPVTGNTCDNLKNKKKLVACLAPDRRVEIEVQGSK